MRPGGVWSREELILALNLYLNEDATADSRDWRVKELSALIDRTPAAVALKLANLRAIDPRRHGGMEHYGTRDLSIWQKFSERRDMLRMVAKETADSLLVPGGEAESRFSERVTGSIFEGRYQATERPGRRMERIYQAQFRREILDAYEHRCALCEIDLDELLVGSHIVPWAEDEKNRLNPRNGLCLCVLHDKAFDRGLIWIEADGVVTLPGRSTALPSQIRGLLTGTGRIRMPIRNEPDPDLLRRKRAGIS